jgi:hypothetical protein
MWVRAKAQAVRKYSLACPKLNYGADICKLEDHVGEVGLNLN